MLLFLDTKSFSESCFGVKSYVTLRPNTEIELMIDVDSFDERPKLAIRRGAFRYVTQLQTHPHRSSRSSWAV